MSKKQWVLQAVVFGSLRRMFRRSPMYNECLNNAKVVVYVKGKTKDKIRRVKFRCACCGKLFDKKEIQCDHVESVIPLEGLPLVNGLPDFNVYIARLFCDVSGLQILDKACHSQKSKDENQKRREFKNERKPKPARATTKRRGRKRKKA